MPMTLEELKFIQSIVDDIHTADWCGKSTQKRASRIIELEIKLKTMDPRKQKTDIQGNNIDDPS